MRTVRGRTRIYEGRRAGRASSEDPRRLDGGVASRLLPPASLVSLLLPQRSVTLHAPHRYRSPLTPRPITTRLPSLQIAPCLRISSLAASLIRTLPSAVTPPSTSPPRPPCTCHHRSCCVHTTHCTPAIACPRPAHSPRRPPGLRPLPLSNPATLRQLIGPALGVQHNQRADGSETANTHQLSTHLSLCAVTRRVLRRSVSQSLVSR